MADELQKIETGKESEVPNFSPPSFVLPTASPLPLPRTPPFGTEQLNPKQLLFFERELARGITHALWNKYFYYFTWLESAVATETLTETLTQAADSGTDTEENIAFSTNTIHPGSWEFFSNSGASFGFDSAGANLITGATNGAQIGMLKRPLSQLIIRFDRIQRFRTAFRLTSVTNQIGYLVRGGVLFSSPSLKYFGFRINGSALEGTVENNNAGTRTNLDLGFTLSANTTYEVEAHFFPREKVVFLIKNSSGIFEERGTTTTLGAAGIPAGDTETDFFEFFLTNSATESKEMLVSYVEYLQER